MVWQMEIVESIINGLIVLAGKMEAHSTEQYWYTAKTEMELIWFQSELIFLDFNQNL